MARNGASGGHPTKWPHAPLRPYSQTRLDLPAGFGIMAVEREAMRTTLPIVFGLTCGCVANINSPTMAAATGFEFITTAVDQSNWMESDPRDLVSVQVYITFDDVLDRLVLVAGKPGFDLTLSTDHAVGFFQSANGNTNTSDTRTSATIAVFPSAEADSYVSIGLLNNDSGTDAIITTGMDWATFNAGGSLQVLNTDQGGGWLVTPDDSQGDATDGHVFIGQFTVASGSTISGTLNYMYADGATGTSIEVDGAEFSMLTPGGGGCIGDFDASGSVNVDDLLTLLAAYELNNGGDCDDDGDTDVDDLLILISAWGPCP